MILSITFSGCLEQTATDQPTETTANRPPIIQECRMEYLDQLSSPTVLFISHAYDPDQDYITYHWSLQDGTHSERQTFVHTFRTPGRYSARLTVADTHGATSTRTILVHINQTYQRPPQP